MLLRAAVAGSIVLLALSTVGHEMAFVAAEMAAPTVTGILGARPTDVDRYSVVDIGLSHSILPHHGGMTGQSAPTVLACWSL